MKNKNLSSAVERRNKRYNDYVGSITPKTNTIKSLWHAFWIGGLTCVIAQGIGDIYALIFPSMSADMVSNITLMTIVTIAIIFTGLGFYDVMARVGGAGSFLPITGFANAISSASMEFRAEGLILGTSVKMFSVVGPVIVNGIFWSTVVGILNLLILGRA